MARKLNVGSGRDIRPASEGWVNMDIAALPGVDVVQSVLEFPWPFEDASFDHVFCSHILEHVPHTVGKHGKDGLVLVMEELHRILKPGGTVEIYSPHHESVDRWADPTHTRVLHPKNFVYFSPGTGYDYYSTAKFHTDVAEVSKRTPIAPDFLPLGSQRLGITTHLAERLPFLKPLLYRRPWELHVILRKPA